MTNLEQAMNEEKSRQVKIIIKQIVLAIIIIVSLFFVATIFIFP